MAQRMQMGVFQRVELRVELPTRAAEMELDGCGAALIWKSRSTDRRLPAAEQLYFACRVTTLAAAVTQMTGFNFTSEISCKVCLDHLILDWRVLMRVDSRSHRHGSS
jgi:hypothetical protein